MKKTMKRLIVTAMAVIMAVAMGVMLTACGEEETPKPKEPTLTYQVVGANVEGGQVGASYLFMELMSDGKGTVYNVHVGGGFGAGEYTENITWSETTDTDGLKTIKIKGGQETVEVYADDDGTFEFEYKYLLLEGQTFTRKAKMEYTGKKEYESVDAWKTAVKALPVSLVKYTSGDSSWLEFYNDKTAKCSLFGNLLDYTWEIKDGEIALTAKADGGYAMPITYSKEGDSETLTLNYGQGKLVFNVKVADLGAAA